MSCPVCGSSPFEPVSRQASGITNGACLGCGHVFLVDVPDDDAESMYADFAQSYDDAYLLDSCTPPFTLAHSRAETLRRWKPNLGTVLEIGAGYGHFLHVLGEDVYRVGLEPSPAGARFARERFGLDTVKQGVIESIGDDWPGRKVDAVCSFHVLEHVRDPYAFLRFAKTRLADDGIVVVAVPELRTLNPDLIELYFLHRAWHLHTFSESSLRFAFARAGFDVVQVSEEPPTPMLRSSMLFIARPAARGAVLPTPVSDVEASLSAARRFHDRLVGGLNRLRDQVAEWRDHGQRVAVYGGGMHTRALFELADLDLATVTAVIDEDPAKAGTAIAGIPVISFSEAIAAAPDVILISTLASEDALLDRLPGKVPAGTRIFGIYRHFFE